MKAQIGDYIKFDFDISKVTDIQEVDGEWFYFLDNGRIVGEDEITIDDIMLESEVVKG